jgi:hypothetical protein
MGTGTSEMALCVRWCRLNVESLFASVGMALASMSASGSNCAFKAMADFDSHEVYLEHRESCEAKSVDTHHRDRFVFTRMLQTFGSGRFVSAESRLDGVY